MERIVRIRRDVMERMLAEARRDPGRECCGLLAGREGVITAIFPAANSLASATAYEIAPEELVRLVREIREAGLKLLGIYHSHPDGRLEPSPRDIARAYHPEAAYFILSPRPDAAEPVRAFAIRDGMAKPLTMEVVSG